MSPKLSPETQLRVDLMYPPKQRLEVEHLLVCECGYNIIYNNDPIADDYAIESLQFAALKVSNGDIDVLKKAIKLAKEDYRDLYFVSGGSTVSIKKWDPKGMGPQPESWWIRAIKKFSGL